MNAVHSVLSGTVHDRLIKLLLVIFDLHRHGPGLCSLGLGEYGLRAFQLELIFSGFQFRTACHGRIGKYDLK